MWSIVGLGKVMMDGVTRRIEDCTQSGGCFFFFIMTVLLIRCYRLVYKMERFVLFY